MYQDNSARAFLLAILLALAVICGGLGAFAYFRGPEADSRAEMMLRTPTATPPPTPNPTVVAERDTAVVRTTRTGGIVGVALIIVSGVAAAVMALSAAARAGAAAGVKVKAMRSLPAWEALPDRAALLALESGYEVYDPRFDSATLLGAGDKSSDLERGELLVNRQHPVAEIAAALMTVPMRARGRAWQKAATHYGLLEAGDEAE
ncbi:MAG: hypothetical protein GWN58_47610 [Anaerolineae bacterium]|nr:hypothetical protein [Anaerolineae bacterium]